MNVLPLIPIIICPYMILASIGILFNENIMKSIFHNNGLLLILIILLVYIIAFIVTALFVIVNIFKSGNSLQLLKANMIIKIIHIPAYILIFLFGIACLITIFTAGISILLIILDCITIIISGIIGLGGIIKGTIEKKISIKKAIIHGFMQFIFIADIISSIIVYRKIKANEQI